MQDCQTKIADFDVDIDQLEQLPSELLTRVQQQELGDLRAKRGALKTRLAGYQRLEPWVRRLVPSGPFETISCIVVALIVSTLVKHIFLITNEYLVCRVAQDVSRELRMQIFKRRCTWIVTATLFMAQPASRRK